MNKIYFLLLIFLNLSAYDAYITPSALKNNLDNQNLIVIDVSDSYKKSHIVGAIAFNVNLLMKLDLSKELKFSKQIKQQDRLQKIFRSLGINNNSKVVIYGRNTQEDIKNASFLAFILISNGFENVSILDGGYMAWVFEYDIFTTRDIPNTEIGDIILSSTNIIVDAKYIKQNNKAVYIDAREPQSYYGVAKNKKDKYIGHIPGAKNSYYMYKFLNDKTIRTQDELREIYIDGLNFKKSDDVIVYANSAQEASVEWFIIYKQMGFSGAKLYYNSYEEYVELKQKTERFKWE